MADPRSPSRSWSRPESGGDPLFTARDVARAAGGEVVVGNPDLPLTAVTIDSRSVPRGSLFVPLAGTRVDGHEYLEEALAAGAAASLVAGTVSASRRERLARSAARAGAALVAVGDTLRALQALAGWHLRRVAGLLTVGVTGSNGKTTTKELIGAALARCRRTAMSPGNLNSETGLPLSCFLVAPGTEVAVFELAMNHLGEIAALAEIVRPGIGLITNIGMAHIGFCGSQEAIAREKKEIFRYYTGREVALIPEDDRFYDLLSQGVKGRVVPFGPRSTRGFEKSEDRGLDGSTIHWEGLRIRLPLVGRHNVSNALAAISVATELGVPRDAIREALEEARPLPNRSEILRGRVTLIADCYNSSPDSVRELLGLLRALPRSERRVGIFGSMLELGDATAVEHARLGEEVAALALDELCFVGAEARLSWEAAEASRPGSEAAWTEDAGELERWIRGHVRDGDLVVLKGSRGVELERVIPLLLPETGVPACS